MTELDRVHAFYCKGGRIPDDFTYVQYSREFEYVIMNVVSSLAFEAELNGDATDAVAIEALLREAAGREGKWVKGNVFHVKYDGSMNAAEAMREETRLPWG
jgi:hypothetical protein